MITRGFFIHAVSKLEIDHGSKVLRMNFMATEVNNANKDKVFSEIGRYPYNLATLLEIKLTENFSETLEHFFVSDGRASEPLMFTFNTNNSALTFGKGWFSKNSPISYEEIVQFMLDARIQGFKILGDGVNFLAYGM